MQVIVTQRITEGISKAKKKMEEAAEKASTPQGNKTAQDAQGDTGDGDEGIDDDDDLRMDWS